MKTLLSFLLIISLQAIAQKDTTVFVTVPVTYTIPAPKIIYINQPPAPVATKPIDTTYGGNGALVTIPDGTILYKSWNVNMTGNGIAFYAYKQSQVYDLTLKNISINGGYNALWSSLGGTVAHKNSYLIDSCNFVTQLGCIYLASPDGIGKLLTIKNTRLKALKSHTLYAQTTVAIYMENVYFDTSNSGINSPTALSLSHFNSKDDIPGAGLTTNFYIHVVANPKAGQFSFSGQCYLDRDTLSIYDIKRDRSAFLHAKNSNLTGWFKGDGENCWGNQITFADTANVANFKYASISLDSGTYVFRNCEFGEIFGTCSPDPNKCNPVKATFINCIIKETANIPAGSEFILYNTAQPARKWNNIYQPKFTLYN